jgi:histidine ammonia-lyase
MDRMLNPNIQEDHLPPFLTEGGGLRSGYMIAQYTAADLVSTNRSHGRPSVDNIPVSGNQEDHVSMSAQSSFIARETVESTLRVVAIELICAAQALDFIEDCSPGRGTRAAYQTIREYIPYLDEDRPIYEEIDIATEMLFSDVLLDNVETEIEGEL